MVDVHALVGDLEAGAAHAEVHGIHVNLAWVGLGLRYGIHIRLFVLVQGNLNVNFLGPPLVDRLGDAQESRVRGGGDLWQKQLVCGGVCFGVARLFGLLKFG